MGNVQTFTEFLRTQSAYIPLGNFIVNILLTALLAFLLSKVYIKYGNSLSNRKRFASNFVLLSMTTMLIISIVKSSLALSLGLVGALSIVRFRAAIKEPEELTYMFLSIAIGLGFGADQRSIAIISFIIISAIIILSQSLKKGQIPNNLHLVISYNSPKKVDFDEITEILREYCTKVHLSRLDESKDLLEASFKVEFRNFRDLLLMKARLKKKNSLLKITFLDTDGLM